MDNFLIYIIALVISYIWSMLNLYLVINTTYFSHLTKSVRGVMKALSIALPFIVCALCVLIVRL